MVNFEIAGEFCHKLIQEERVSVAIGANGLPLNVVGQVKIPVRLGEFEQNKLSLSKRSLS